MFVINKETWFDRLVKNIKEMFSRITDSFSKDKNNENSMNASNMSNTAASGNTRDHDRQNGHSRQANAAERTQSRQNTARTRSANAQMQQNTPRTRNVNAQRQQNTPRTVNQAEAQSGNNQADKRTQKEIVDEIKAIKSKMEHEIVGIRNDRRNGITNDKLSDKYRVLNADAHKANRLITELNQQFIDDSKVFQRRAAGMSARELQEENIKLQQRKAEMSKTTKDVRKTINLAINLRSMNVKKTNLDNVQQSRNNGVRPNQYSPTKPRNEASNEINDPTKKNNGLNK